MRSDNTIEKTIKENYKTNLLKNKKKWANKIDVNPH